MNIRPLLTGLLLMAIACQSPSGNLPDQTNDPKIADVPAPAGPSRRPDIRITFDSLTLLGQELRRSLRDPATDPYFLQTWLRQALIPHPDDNQMLRIPDSLFCKKAENRYFYFAVFTCSLNGDGFYTEGAGSAAMACFEQQPAVVARYLREGPGLDPQAVARWAHCLAGEIAIAHEGEELKAVQELTSRIRKAAQHESPENQAVLAKVLAAVQKEVAPEQVD